MKLRIPTGVVTKVVVSCITSNSSSIIWICRMLDGSHAGNCDCEESRSEPCFHCTEE